MQQSIYDAIGGAAAVEAAVDLFYAKVWGDPSLSVYFAEVDRGRLKGHQRAFITLALGGPDGYRGRSLEVAHRGRAITDGAFDRVVGHLVDALGELGVPDETVREIAARLAPTRSDVVERIAPALA
jgi:hemoglobin